MGPTFDQTLNKPYYGNTFLPNAPTASFYPTINERPLQVNPVFGYPPSKTDSRSQSTQTEHIFCGHCRYPFTRGSNGNIANTAKESEKLNETLYMDCMTDRPSTVNLNQDIYKDINHTVDPSEILNNRFISNEMLQNPTKTIMSGLSDNVVANPNNVNQGVTQNQHLNNVEDTLMINDISISRNSGVSSESKEIITQKKEVLDGIDGNMTHNQFRAVDDIGTKYLEEATVTTEDKNSSKSKMFETVASKSDDESINHEFDFLESDRKPSIKNKTVELERRVSHTKSDNMPENLKHDTTCESVLENNPVETNSKANIDVKSQYNNVTDTAITKNVKNTGSLLTPSDAKIDSSLSEGMMI